MHSHHPRTRGLTLVEVIIVIIVLAVIIAVLLPAIGRPTTNHRHMRDAMQVRSAVQSLIVWASNTGGAYPLPSEFDRANATLDQPAYTKDTTANILSLLIFNGHIAPEGCISAAESNTAQIQRYDTYQYDKPSGATKPADALWDPAFRGTPDDPITYANISSGTTAHQSYAHLLPFGKRRAQWADNYNSTEAVFGNRGPTYAQSDAAPAAAKPADWKLLPGPLGTQSNTLLIHGGRSTWEGNIGYNDNHVNFETRPAPDAVSLFILGPSAPGKPGKKAAAPDNLFVNEFNEYEGDGPDAANGTITSGTNAYLRPIAEIANPARPKVWRD